MKKPTTTRNGTVADKVVCGKSGTGNNDGETATETVAAVLTEIGLHCNEVIAEKIKVDDTFFSTRSEASRLKTACENGNAGEVLRQLCGFRGEPNPSELIARLKSAMTAEKQQSAGRSGGQVKADSQTNPEASIHKEVPATVSSTSVQCPEDGNVQDAAASGGGNEAMAAEPMPSNNDAGDENGIGNQAVAHAEGQDLTEATAIPEVELIDIDSIEIDDEAASMFERSPAVKDAIRESMKKDRFKQYLFVKAWGRDDGSCTPYDGHTRLEIAAELGITRIPVVKTRFATRKEFLEAAINEQLERRNLSIRDKFSIVKHLAPLEAENASHRHGKKQSADKSADLKAGRADAIIGAKIGCGPDTVARIRFLIKTDDSELLEKVFNDDMSISSAYKALRRKMKQVGADKDIEQPQVPPTGRNGDAGKPETSVIAEKTVDTQSTVEGSAPRCEASAQSGHPMSEQLQGLQDQQITQPKPDQPPLKSSDVQGEDDTIVITGPQLAKLIALISDADITVLISDLDTWDPKTADFIRQCLESRAKTGRQRTQKTGNPSKEVAFGNGARRAAASVKKQKERDVK